MQQVKYDGTYTLDGIDYCISKDKEKTPFFHPGDISFALGKNGRQDIIDMLKPHRLHNDLAYVMRCDVMPTELDNIVVPNVPMLTELGLYKVLELAKHEQSAKLAYFFYSILFTELVHNLNELHANKRKLVYSAYINEWDDLLSSRRKAQDFLLATFKEDFTKEQQNYLYVFCDFILNKQSRGAK